MVETWLESAFDPLAKAVVVALCHGTRIIGATILVPDPAAEDQFAPGPCVQMEYRNRGLGTALLAEGLRRLQEAGLSRATTIARSNGPVAKFLYPKFAGVGCARRAAPPRCLSCRFASAEGATFVVLCLTNDSALGRFDKFHDRPDFFARAPLFAQLRDRLSGV